SHRPPPGCSSAKSLGDPPVYRNRVLSVRHPVAPRPDRSRSGHPRKKSRMSSFRPLFVLFSSSFRPLFVLFSSSFRPLFVLFSSSLFVLPFRPRHFVLGPPVRFTELRCIVPRID